MIAAADNQRESKTNAGVCCLIFGGHGKFGEHGLASQYPAGNHSTES
jgi:hypothetical protein